MIAVNLFRPKIKKIDNLDDLKNVRVNDAVEIPRIRARGIVYSLDSIRGNPVIRLIERKDGELCQLGYEFDGNEINWLNYKRGMLCTEEDTKKYEPKLRRAGL